MPLLFSSQEWKLFDKFIRSKSKFAQEQDTLTVTLMQLKVVQFKIFIFQKKKIENCSNQIVSFRDKILEEKMLENLIYWQDALCVSSAEVNNCLIVYFTTTRLPLGTLTSNA